MSPGQTVNQTFYREVLERLRKRVARVDQALHHDNASFHTTVSINEFLAEKRIPMVLQPPIHRFSVPVISFYSPGSKNHLKVRHFGTLDNIQKSVTDELKGIPAEAFQLCYEQRKQRLRHCIAAQGNSLKGLTLICKKNKIYG